MSNEIGIQSSTALGSAPYALVRNSVNQIWNGSAFVAYVTANIGTYDLPLTEQGTASRYWTVSFPTAINPGVYTVQFFDTSGSPTEGDTLVGVDSDFEWNGGKEVDPNIIHQELEFDVDNPNNQDEYSTLFKINGFEVSPSQITGTPTIRVGKRDDTDLVATIAMVQVSTTARWKHDETSNRIVLGETYFVTITVTIFGVARIFTEMIRRDK